MLIHNKRLHPRRPCEPNEHYHGCMLHEMQEQAANVRNSKSPTSRSRTSSTSSSSLLNQRWQRNPSTSSSNSALYPSRTPTPLQSLNWKLASDSSTPNKRYSTGAFPSSYDQINGMFYDTVDSPSKPSLKSPYNSNTKQKSKSTICLNSSLITATDTGKPDKRANTVTFKCYDSPDEIIANLFPGIDDDKEPTYLRKGHGAAQMAKNRSQPRDWSINGRSSSAAGNYATASDHRKSRPISASGCDYSSSSSSSPMAINKDRYHRSQTNIIGRLYSIDRDLNSLWCVLVVYRVFYFSVKMLSNFMGY